MNPSIEPEEQVGKTCYPVKRRKQSIACWWKQIMSRSQPGFLYYYYNLERVDER